MQIPLRIRCGIAADSLTESNQRPEPMFWPFYVRNMEEYSGGGIENVILHDIVSSYSSPLELAHEYLRGFGFSHKTWPNEKMGQYYGYYEEDRWVTGQYSKKGRIEGWENENSEIYAKISLAEWQNDDSFYVEIFDKKKNVRFTRDRISLKGVKEVIEVLRPHFRGEAVAIMTGIM